ncbi:hypothetical protein ACJIZ3_016019 [Penstemon smallii]|uniref:Uncharacterized protein n=1 Tax=Penstemon smallii TaxID=265156 RepID=A0ABD3RTX3_9LAMI
MAMAMAMAATTQISRNYSSISSFHTLNNQSMHITQFHLHFTASSKRFISHVQASYKSPTEKDQEANAASNKATFVSQEDLEYLVRVGCTSFAGAAAIKYGSVIFPEIARPNIVQALIMILAPVIVAVVLLIRQSRVN